MRLAVSIAYALAFQLGWFACVIYGDGLSALVATAFITLHIFYRKHFYQPLPKTHQIIRLYKELLWIGVVVALGFVLEIGFLSTGLLQRVTTQLYFPPFWLVCIWIIFAIGLRSCFAFLFLKPNLSCLLCGVVIPLNYLAGSLLNREISISQPLQLSLTLMGITWMVFFRCLYVIKREYFEDIFHD